MERGRPAPWTNRRRIEIQDTLTREGKPMKREQKEALFMQAASEDSDFMLPSDLRAMVKAYRKNKTPEWLREGVKARLDAEGSIIPGPWKLSFHHKTISSSKNLKVVLTKGEIPRIEHNTDKRKRQTRCWCVSLHFDYEEYAYQLVPPALSVAYIDMDDAQYQKYREEIICAVADDLVKDVERILDEMKAESGE